MDKFERSKIRLSDRILCALELALEQDDYQIAELLTRAMEMSMTRNTGGGEFIERRDYPPEIENAMSKLHSLKKENINA